MKTLIILNNEFAKNNMSKTDLARFLKIPPHVLSRVLANNPDRELPKKAQKIIFDFFNIENLEQNLDKEKLLQAIEISKELKKISEIPSEFVTVGINIARIFYEDESWNELYKESEWLKDLFLHKDISRITKSLLKDINFQRTGKIELAKDDLIMLGVMSLFLAPDKYQEEINALVKIGEHTQNLVEQKFNNSELL